MKLFATIEKVEELEDGHLLVSGVASSEAVDSDGEIITSEAMKAAIPDYMTCANVREMHQAKAAGVAVSCEVGDDGRTYLTAKVVDSEAKEKVRQSVYKGFSIGGKVLKRTKNIIEALKLVEISLVDRPANPEALFSVAKMEDTMDTDIQPEVQPAPETTDPAPAPAPESAKAEAQGIDLAKFMGEEVWDAQTALNALDAIMWLLSKEQAEAMENPAQVQALNTVVENLKRFIASEIMEDNSGKAAGAEDLEKRGAKFSKATKAALKKVQDAHGSLTECMKALGEAFDAEGKEDEDEESEKAEAIRAGGEAIVKAAGLQEELTKAEAARDEAITKAQKLEAELNDLKAQKPLKAVPIDKAADGTFNTLKSPGARPADATPIDPLDAMKMVHSTGGQILNPYNRLGR